MLVLTFQPIVKELCYMSLSFSPSIQLVSSSTTPHLSSSLFQSLPPTERQINETIENIIKVISHDSGIHKALARTGSAAFLVQFNNTSELAPTVGTGFKVTKELVQEILKRLGQYFPHIDFFGDKMKILPSDKFTLGIDLQLYPSKIMPPLSPSASPTEIELYEYVQSALTYYQSNQAAKDAARHILNQLDLPSLPSKKITCHIEEFSFNPRRSSAEPCPDELKGLHWVHQIPEIKRIVSEALSQIPNIKYTIEVQGEGKTYQPGIFKVQISNPNRVTLFTDDFVDAKDVVLLTEDLHKQGLSTWVKAAAIQQQISDLASHYRAVLALKEAAEHSDPNHPLARMIKNLSVEWQDVLK